MENNKFFKRDNIQNFLWGLFLAFAGFIGSQIWNKISGPSPVQVVNERVFQRDTIINIVQIDRNFEPELSLTEINYNKIDSLIAKRIEPLFDSTLVKDTIIEKYTLGDADDYGSISINDIKFKADKSIEFDFEIYDERIVDDIQTVRIKIGKRLSENSMLTSWSGDFALERKETKFEINSALNLGTGQYEVTAGYYLKSEKDREFPTYYSKTFNIEAF